MILEPRVILPSFGYLTLPVKIVSTSNEEGFESFQIQVSAQNPKLQIRPGISNNIIVVDYKLQVEQNIEDVWYKDFGRRDNNWIKLRVKLIDHKGVVTNRFVLLQVLLYYEDMKELVQNQDILQFKIGQIFQIDQTGEVVIQIRVPSPTISHQSKRFTVKIQPDIINFPENNDIGLTFTTPFRVRLKPPSHLREAVQARSIQLNQSFTTSIPSTSTTTSTTSPTPLLEDFHNADVEFLNFLAQNDFF